MDVSGLSRKQRRTLEDLFRRPVPMDIRWQDVESLLLALGCRIIQGRGSRRRAHLNGVQAAFHEPHPSPELPPSTVRAASDFLRHAGVEPK